MRGFRAAGCIGLIGVSVLIGGCSTAQDREDDAEPTAQSTSTGVLATQAATQEPAAIRPTHTPESMPTEAGLSPDDFGLTATASAAQRPTERAAGPTHTPTHAATRAAGLPPFSGKSSPVIETFPMPWPPALITNEELAEARNCEYLLLAPDEPRAAPRTGCDWALHAVARLTEDAPPTYEAREAFARAISLNEAIALTAAMLDSPFFGSVVFRAPPPPVVGQPIVGAQIHGGQDPTQESHTLYDVTLTNGDTAPTYTGSLILVSWETGSRAESAPTPFSGSVDVALVQALGPALVDLIPVDATATLVPGMESFSPWEVTLTLADGTSIFLTTDDSELVSGGGPWYVQIEGQWYIQHSPNFLVAISRLVRAMGLGGGTDDAHPAQYLAEPGLPLTALFPGR